MAESKTTSSDETDPRRLLAQRYMQAAHDDLAAKDLEKPKMQRQRPRRLEGKPTWADLRPSISSSTYLHGLLVLFVLTGGLLALAVCYAIMNTLFVAGRVIALPAGILCFIGLSYCSAFYLGVIESTAQGHTEPDDALTGDWRDWFWTLPATVGVLLMTAGIGWLISRLAPDSTWTIIGVTIWLLYPVLQLSTLETGSIASPISLPVLSTLATRPLMWATLFGISFLLGKGVSSLTQVFWPARPFVTMLLVGPIATLSLLIYAWLLGQLARWLTIGGR